MASAATSQRRSPISASPSSSDVQPVRSHQHRGEHPQESLLCGVLVPTATLGGHGKLLPTRGPLPRMLTLLATTPVTTRKVMHLGMRVLQGGLRAGLPPTFFEGPRRLPLMHI